MLNQVVLKADFSPLITAGAWTQLPACKSDTGKSVLLTMLDAGVVSKGNLSYYLTKQILDTRDIYEPFPPVAFE